ncbi:unnamed protein product [Bursaphelenchus xylophilus]|uniref:Eukaryotic translation initiation factor 3 subunit L n=1 Tax=Bursaphelenchus xylophilus TaxID=6326 RepID=A0A1I7RLU2_BURXY|nr:unnamed protein product [Bursaphelenchus xylophilus]CAG9106246.1 unnamed protein product [Bursaphelenchus xylophilus]
MESENSSDELVVSNPHDIQEDVLHFLIYLHRIIQEKQVDEVYELYKHFFGEQSDRFFSERSWPDAKKLEDTNSFDHLFIVLYKELYYRDLYQRSRRGPSLQHRYESYLNYQELFSELLCGKEQPTDIILPNVWLWNIIDEFVYQFQAFCLYRTNPTKRTADDNEEMLEFEELENVWNIYPVLNILYSLLDKSQVNEQLKAIREGRNPDDVADEFGRSPLYFKLGYFALIGLLRMHVLLGDYHQALRTVENLEFDPKGLYNAVPSCFVTLHYFVGFSHMMMRNYGEATKIFVNCLLYIQRTQNLQPQGQQQNAKKPTKYDVIAKTHEQLYYLLAICLCLQPQRIDEAIQTQLMDRLGERVLRMSNGEIDEFRHCFMQGAPKTLSPTTTVFDGSNVASEPLIRQCNVFLEGIESQICLPVLRGYLKLYTSLPVAKLASFMDIGESELDTFVGKLLTFKLIVNELGKDTRERAEQKDPDDDDTVLDLDFFVDNGMIVVAESKVDRRITEHYIKYILKLRDVKKIVDEIPAVA